LFNPDWLAVESVSSFPWNTHAYSLIRPVMLGLGGFSSSWPLQDHKRPLSFRGLLSATDRGQAVEALESSPSPHDRTTRKRPFGFRRCYSGLTGSFEQEAVSGCRMVVVGSRPLTVIQST
jgi:hypothetical protein